MSTVPQGISFPLRFGASGHLVRSSGSAKLVENMKSLVLSRLGERSMEPEFGTAGIQQVFRGAAPSLSVVETLTREALAKYEPRVTVGSVTVKQLDRREGTGLAVEVVYRVRDTGETGNFTLRVGGDS